MPQAAFAVPNVSEPQAGTSALADLEGALIEALERFDVLSKAWPKGRDPLTRARIGKRHETALSEIGALRDQIARIPARSLADVAVKLRRLLVVVEGPEAETLLATALDGLESCTRGHRI